MEVGSDLLAFGSNEGDVLGDIGEEILPNSESWFPLSLRDEMEGRAITSGEEMVLEISDHDESLFGGEIVEDLEILLCI